MRRFKHAEKEQPLFLSLPTTETLRLMMWAMEDELLKVTKKKWLEKFKGHQDSMVSPKPKVENFRKEEVVPSITFSKRSTKIRTIRDHWIFQQKVVDHSCKPYFSRVVGTELCCNHELNQRLKKQGLAAGVDHAQKSGCIEAERDSRRDRGICRVKRRFWVFDTFLVEKNCCLTHFKQRKTSSTI